MKAYFSLFLLTAVLSFMLTPAVRVMGVRGDVYTPVRKRDVHREPIPKLGGFAMAIAVLIALGVASTVPFLSGIFTDPDPMTGILIAIIITIVLGAADDLWDLPWYLKFGGQILAGAAIGYFGIRVQALPVGWFEVDNFYLEMGLTIFVVVLTINAMNFIDGLDGLAAGVAIIGGSAFFFYTYLLTRTINAYDYANMATLLMAILLGATVGFLPFNFYPARIFMGEIGAQLIGVLMATAAVAVTADVGALDGFRFRNVPAYMPILLPLAVMLLPLLDLSMAVIRRTARRTSPFSADRGHIHHKLVDGGYTHRQAVLLLYLWTFVIAYGAVSLNFFDSAKVITVVVIALAGTLALTIRPWIVRRAYYRRLNQLRAKKQEERQAKEAAQQPQPEGGDHGAQD